MSLGIYIHVPFCLRKCPYCDFYSLKFDGDAAEKYVQAVCRNIRAYKKYDLSADTVYFGGGTPSLLTPKQIGSILSEINNSFGLHFPEITLEANPCSVDFEKLKDFRLAGISRLSFGIQSADDKQLDFLGRLHNFSAAKVAVGYAEKAGFNNVSCDIMLGLAGQSLRSLTDTVNEITSLPVCHISAYMLKIEEGTAFDCDKVRKSVADEDMQCEMYLQTCEQLESKGFEQYEISNFAKDGHYSRHNLKYWQGEEYIGYGPAAHSFWSGRRFYVPKDLGKFICEPLQTEIVSEQAPDKLEEYIMLSLRLKWGIDLSRIAQLGNRQIAEHIYKKAMRLSVGGLCVVSDNNVYLTPKGFLVSNLIISEFLDFA